MLDPQAEEILKPGCRFAASLPLPPSQSGGRETGRLMPRQAPLDPLCKISLMLSSDAFGLQIHPK
jgi:hypothetical protein